MYKSDKGTTYRSVEFQQLDYIILYSYYENVVEAYRCNDMEIWMYGNLEICRPRLAKLLGSGIQWSSDKYARGCVAQGTKKLSWKSVSEYNGEDLSITFEHKGNRLGMERTLNVYIW